MERFIRRIFLFSLLLLFILLQGQFLVMKASAEFRLEDVGHLVVSNYGTSIRNPEQVYDAEKVAQRYEKKVKELQGKPERYLYLEQLIEYYNLVGEREIAYTYLLSLLEEVDYYDQRKAVYTLAKMYYEDRQFAQGIQVIEDYLEKYRDVTDLQLRLLKGNLHGGLGEYEKGFQEFEIALEMGENEGNLHSKSLIEENIKRMEWYKAEKGVTVQGKVVKDGKPLAKVRVGILNGYDRSYGTPEYIEITDAAGEYSFENLPVGQYMVFIELELNEGKDYFINYQLNGGKEQMGKIGKEPGVYQFDFALLSPIQQLLPKDGKVKKPETLFTWREYPGAAYYEVSFTHLSRDEQGQISSGSGLTQKFPSKTNQLVIDLHQLKSPNYGKSYSSNYISPRNILGYIYPGSELSWEVTAFDEEGVRIGSSNAAGSILRNVRVIQIAFGQLESGDLKLLEHDYFGALNSYLDEYSKLRDETMKEKIYTLIESLYHLYLYDYEQKVDLSKMITTFKRANQILPEVKHFRFLSQILYQEGEYDSTREELLQAIQIQPDSNNDAYHLLALVELQTGNYLQAREYLEKTNKVGYQIAYNLFTGQEMEIAEEWQVSQAILRGLAKYLDEDQLTKFYQAVAAEDQQRVQEMLKGDDLTSSYLQLLWKIVTVYRPWDDYDFRSQLYQDSRELSELLPLTAEEKKVFFKFMGLWQV